ncbi:hypothetical protein [Breoghania sp.]|nr:hypothetical protein [Breoghania sp.]MDJ0933612.1 hypothetical protein [Breoghania sp.]
MILAQIDGDPMEARRVVVAPHLVERESAGPRHLLGNSSLTLS